MEMRQDSSTRDDLSTREDRTAQEDRILRDDDFVHEGVVDVSDSRGTDLPVSIDSRGSLLPDDRTDALSGRWTEIQTRFVDDPRTAVEQADSLVAETIEELQRSFTTERDRLEQQWRAGEDVSTEDLRIALRRYRSFFSRLLAA